MELHVKGARGDATELAELSIPEKYRWVPEGIAPDSRYNVAQLYSRLAENIRPGKPVNPGFDAAVMMKATAQTLKTNPSYPLIAIAAQVSR